MTRKQRPVVYGSLRDNYLANVNRLLHTRSDSTDLNLRESSPLGLRLAFGLIAEEAADEI